MGKKLTSNKAKQILHDKEIKGHPLTDKQRRFFGAVASGYIKAETGGWLDKYQDGGKSLAETQKESIQQSIDFLKNWYTKRAELPQFKDVSERRLAILQNPLNIVYQNPEEMMKQGLAGYYSPSEKTLNLADPTIKGTFPDYEKFMSVNVGSPLTTHELFHKLQYEAPQKESVRLGDISKMNDLSFSKPHYSWITQSEFINPETGKLSSPTSKKGIVSFNPEPEAITAMLRQAENIDPTKPLTSEDIQSYIDKYKKYKGIDLKTIEPIKQVEYHRGKLIQNMFELMKDDPKKIADYINQIAANKQQESLMVRNGGSIESRMGGLTDIPFRYNGAWGGPSMQDGGNIQPPMAGANQNIPMYQMGGNVLPGTVGFTYARTGSTPSEGPYAKKTMPSAQNGIFYPQAEDLTDIDKFGKEYVNSENFKYLSKLQGDKPWQTRARIKIVNNFDPNNDVSFVSEGPSFVFGTIRRPKRNKMTLSYDMGDWPSYRDINAHEYGHLGYNDGRLQIPNKSLGRVEGANKSYQYNIETGEMDEDLAHDIAPQENRADLFQLRYQLNKRGIFDSRKKDKFTQEHLDRFKGTNEWNRLQRLYDDKDIIWMMNNIAKNNAGNQPPIAQNGMTFYQHGLDWKPRNISQDGSTLSMDALSPFNPLGISFDLFKKGYEAISGLFSEEPEAQSVEEVKTRVPRELLLKQAFKESRFNPKAVSPKGYKGLTQIGEDIIADYIKKTGKKNIDPFNPKHAKDIQEFAMDDLYNSNFINKPGQSDDVRLAKTFAAYNLGRTKLSNFLNKKKKAGEDIYNSLDWVNDLPKETSDYINKIVFNRSQEFDTEFKESLKNPEYQGIVSMYQQNNYRKGGVIKDDMGQWAHPGEITEIGSNNITMKGVPYPVLGISDEGDSQMMYPEQEYKFKGSKVTEYPVTNWLDKYK